MGILENALRDALSAQVGTPPAVDDAAGRAIRSAGRIRRRRMLAGGLAVAMGVAVAGFAPSILRGRGTEVPVVGPALTPPALDVRPVDVLVRNKILTRTDQVVEVPDLAYAGQAWRVRAEGGGWLVEYRDVSQYAQPRSLYQIKPDQRPAALVHGTSIVVAPDGSKLAWGHDGQAFMAPWSGDGIVYNGAVSTSNVGDLSPVAFAGGAVILGAPVAGTDEFRYDVWRPVEGDYQPNPRQRGRILGATASDNRLLGFTGACLAEIDPVSLGDLRTACVPNLPTGTDVHGWPSPDGKWLVLTTKTNVVLVNLAAVWTAPRIEASWDVKPTSVAWLDGSSFVVGTMSRIVRLSGALPSNQTEWWIDSAMGDPVVVMPSL